MGSLTLLGQENHTARLSSLLPALCIPAHGMPLILPLPSSHLQPPFTFTNVLQEAFPKPYRKPGFAVTLSETPCMLLQHLYYSFSNNGSCNKLFNEHVPFQMQTRGRHHIHHSCTPAPQLGAWLRIRAPGICYMVSQSIFHPVVLCTVHSGPQEKFAAHPKS